MLGEGQVLRPSAPDGPLPASLPLLNYVRYTGSNGVLQPDSQGALPPRLMPWRVGASERSHIVNAPPRTAAQTHALSAPRGGIPTGPLLSERSLPPPPALGERRPPILYEFEAPALASLDTRQITPSAGADRATHIGSLMPDAGGHRGSTPRTVASQAVRDTKNGYTNRGVDLDGHGKINWGVDTYTDRQTFGHTHDHVHRRIERDSESWSEQFPDNYTWHGEQSLRAELDPNARPKQIVRFVDDPLDDPPNRWAAGPPAGGYAPYYTYFDV